MKGKWGPSYFLVCPQVAFDVDLIWLNQVDKTWGWGGPPRSGIQSSGSRLRIALETVTGEGLWLLRWADGWRLLPPKQGAAPGSGFFNGTCRFGSIRTLLPPPNLASSHHVCLPHFTIHSPRYSENFHFSFNQLVRRIIDKQEIITSSVIYPF